MAVIDGVEVVVTARKRQVGNGVKMNGDTAYRAETRYTLSVCGVEVASAITYKSAVDRMRKRVAQASEGRDTVAASHVFGV